MKKIALITLLCLVALTINQNDASAHTPFKKELQTTYGLKTVSCYTCHSRKDDVPAADWENSENTKEFRNSFGDEIHKLMASGNWSARIEAAEDEDDDTQDAVEAAAVAAFKAALEKAVQVKSESGKTYHEELTAGTLDGVKK